MIELRITRYKNTSSGRTLGINSLTVEKNVEIAVEGLTSAGEVCVLLDRVLRFDPSENNQLMLFEEPNVVLGEN